MSGKTQPNVSEIKRSLSAVLNSKYFSSSRQLRSFLNYVVSETLQGRGNKIKAYSIAVDALNKPASFDASDDPVVRVLAGRLRDALAKFYNDEEIEEVSVRIEIPIGSYQPLFAPTKINAEHIEPDATTHAPFSKRVMVTSFSVASLFVFALIGAWLLSAPGGANKPVQQPIEDYPIVAVLPFVNLTNNKDLSFLGSGIQHQIVTDLWRFHTMRVLLVNKPNTLHQNEDGIRHDPSDTNVKFVVSGAISELAGNLTISTSLRRARDKKLVWKDQQSELLSRRSYSSFLVEVSKSVSTELGVPHGVVEQDVIQHIGVTSDEDHLDNSNAYLCHMRFMDWTRNGSSSNSPDVGECLSRLLKKYPNDSSLLSAEAWFNALSTDPSRAIFRSGNIAERRQSARDQAKRAVQINPGNDLAQVRLGLIQWMMADEQSAINSFRRAQKLNPLMPLHQADLGLFLCLMDRCDEGYPISTNAMAFEPHPPNWYHVGPAVYYLVNGQPEKAMPHATILAGSGDQNDCTYLVAAAALSGQINKAAKCRQVIVNNRAKSNGDPLGGSRFWVRGPKIVKVLERGVAQSGF